MTDQNKMPEHIWVDEIGINGVPDVSVASIHSSPYSTPYTRTNLYTAVCAERDALRELCEGMAETLDHAWNGLKWWRNEYPERGSSADDEMDADISDALAAYEKHKGVG